MLLASVQKFILFHANVSIRDDEVVQWKKLFYVCLIASGVVYGQEIFCPTLGIDDYLYLFPGNNVYFEIYRGTWVFTLFNKLLPGAIIAPVVSTVFFVAVNILSAVILCISWNKNGSPGPYDFLLVLMFALFPYFACQAAFNYYQFGYALSTLFAVLSALLAINATSIIQRGVCIAYFVLAVGFYQGAIGVVSTAFVAMLMAAIVDNVVRGRSVLSDRGYCRRCIYATANLAIAAIAYVAIHKCIMLLSHISHPGQQYAVEFDVAFWKRLPEVLVNLFGLITGYERILPVASVLAVCGVFVLSLGLTSYFSIAKKLWVNAAIGPAFFVLLLISPGIVLFVSKMSVSPRSAVAYAAVWMLVAWIAFRFNYKYIGRVVAIVVVFVAFSFALKNNEMFFSQRLTMQMDQTTAALIYDRVAQIDDYKNKSVTFVGARHYLESGGHLRYDPEVFGFSSFEWDGGNPHRISALFKAIGLGDLRFRFPDLSTKSAEEYARVTGRQPWPSNESVYEDSIGIVVWLGQPGAWPFHSR